MCSESKIYVCSPSKHLCSQLEPSPTSHFLSSISFSLHLFYLLEWCFFPFAWHFSFHYRLPPFTSFECRWNNSVLLLALRSGVRLSERHNVPLAKHNLSQGGNADAFMWRVAYLLSWFKWSNCGCKHNSSGTASWIDVGLWEGTRISFSTCQFPCFSGGNLFLYEWHLSSRP